MEVPQVNVGWFGSPGIKEDVVAIVLGNGHDENLLLDMQEWVSNANLLFGHTLDKESGAVVYQSVKAADVCRCKPQCS